MVKLVGKAQKQDYLPFIVSFIEQVSEKSFNILAKNDKKFYLMERADFVKAVSSFMKNGMKHSRDMDDGVTSIYKSVISKNDKFLETKKKFLKSFTKEFSYFMDSFHKLVEARLSTHNFGAIYRIDEGAKILKHQHYDNSILFEKLNEKITKKFENQLFNLYLSNRFYEDRFNNYEQCLSLDLLEFVSETHNSNMKEIREKMEKIMGEPINLYDVELKNIIDDPGIDGKAKLFVLFSRFTG